MTLAQTKRAMQLAASECVRNGLTSVDEARVTPLMVQAFHELVRDGQMPLRVYAMLDGADKDLVERWLKRGPEIDPHHQLTVRAFKLFADGALGSRGAALLEPYRRSPNPRHHDHAGVRGLQFDAPCSRGWLSTLHACHRRRCEPRRAQRLRTSGKGGAQCA